jgi:hypothetical protein
VVNTGNLPTTAKWCHERYICYIDHIKVLEMNTNEVSSLFILMDLNTINIVQITLIAPVNVDQQLIPLLALNQLVSKNIPTTSL